MMFKKRGRAIEKLKSMWTNPKSCPPPAFPIFRFELPNPYDFTIKNDIEQVFGDIDFYGWEWFNNERFVDMEGRVYKCKYDKRLLTFPIEIEQKLNLIEVKKLVLNVLEAQSGNSRMDYYGLTSFTQSSETINSIFLELSENYPSG